MSAGGHRLLLTGASGGLGHAFALALAPECAAMILCGRDPARLHALRQKLEAMHPGLALRTVAGDLTQASVQAGAVESAGTLGAPLDLLIHAAGIGDFSAFDRQDPAAMERLVAVNLLTPIQLTQRLLPLLCAAPKAQIINIGSIFGYLGYPGFALYCATKFGLRGFSQALRRELSDTGVSVRYFAPRAVKTALNTRAVEEMNRELGTAQDTPQRVAAELMRFIRTSGPERRIGFPERLYVWLNRLMPSVNDKAIRAQLPVIRKHIGASSAPWPEQE